jgi:uncharacterized peroxidase-related enzyme
MDAPKPRFTAEAEPFIPYVGEEDYPEPLKPDLERYQERMGFIPNALKLYLHRPEIAATLWELNNKVMRDPSSTLEPLLKRRLAALASKINGCAYCVSHHCNTLKSPSGGEAEGWGMEEGELRELLSGDLEPQDARERACFEYVRAASEDPSNVPREVLERLTQHLTPAQIVELACVVGFWKLYNTIHDSLHIPIEAALLGDSGYVDL